MYTCFEINLALGVKNQDANVKQFPGLMPLWHAVTGWGLAGTSQDATTGKLPRASWTFESVRGFLPEN